MLSETNYRNLFMPSLFAFFFFFWSTFKHIHIYVFKDEVEKSLIQKYSNKGYIQFDWLTFEIDFLLARSRSYNFVKLGITTDT